MENLERWRYVLERERMKDIRSQKTEYMCVNKRELS